MSIHTEYGEVSHTVACDYCEAWTVFDAQEYSQDTVWEAATKKGFQRTSGGNIQCAECAHG